MINLYIAGVLEKSQTFPHRIDPELVAATPTIPGEHGGIFHSENLRALEVRNIGSELRRAISASMRNAVALKPVRKEIIEDKVKYLDHVYAHGYVYSMRDRLFGRRF